jgi:hypothetical protein
MDEIQRLENRNNILLNEIAQLNDDRQTAQEQRKIAGNFEEIEINNLEISRLRTQLNNDAANE